MLGWTGPASDSDRAGRRVDTLAGPDGLTGQASTFSRTDVVDALAKRLPVARSARGSAHSGRGRRRPVPQGAGRPGRPDRRLGVERFSTPELLAVERQLVTAPPGGPTKAAPSFGRRLSARSWTATPPPGRTRQPWSRPDPRRRRGRRRGRPGRVRQDLGAGAGPGSVRADGLSGPGHRADRDRYPRAGRRRLQRGPNRRPAPAGFGPRPDGAGRPSVLVVDEAAMVATRKLAPLLGMRSGRGPRWCWLVMTASSPPSPPAAGSAPPPSIGRQRVDRQPSPGRGLGAAGHRRCARRQPGAGDRRLCRA